MKCKKCGAELAPDAKFCRECGEKVELTGAAPAFCRECGCKLPQNAKFCPGCGAQIVPMSESGGDSSVVLDIEDKSQTAPTEDIAQDSVQSEESNDSFPFLPSSGSTTNDYEETDKHKKENDDPRIPQGPDMQAVAEFSRKAAGAAKKGAAYTGRKFMEFWTPLSTYSRFMTVCAAVLVLLTFIAFCAGKVLAGIIGLIQLILLAGSWLMHFGKLPEVKPNLQKYFLIAVAVLLLPHFLAYGIGKTPKPPVQSSAPVIEQHPTVPKETAPKPETEASGEVFDTVPETTEKATTAPVIETSEPAIAETKEEIIPVVPETTVATATATTEATAAPATYAVQLEVRCDQNFIFSQYDVNVFVDGEKVDVLKHGSTETFTVNLTPEKHNIEFVSKDSSSVKGESEFTLHEEMLYVYKIHCSSEQVHVEEVHSESMRPLTENEVKIPSSADDIVGRDINEVFNELDDIGFSDKEIVEIKDAENEGEIGTIKSISVGGKSTFSKGTIFEKDSKVIAEIHAPAWTVSEIDDILQEATDQPASEIVKIIEENRWVEAGFEIMYSVDGIPTELQNPEGKFMYEGFSTTQPNLIFVKFLSEEKQNAKLILDKNFPQHNALKAAVVALTNGQATDVFAWDGNSYDVNKFHNYTDLNGFYLTVLSDGGWLPENENTWRVFGLECMMSGTGTCIMANMEVSFENNQYHISNLDRTIAAREDLNSDDDSKVNFEHIDPSESTPYLTVPAYKIQGERDQAAERERNNRTMPTAVRTAWIESQFSGWDGHHKQLEDMIISSLNDEDSYKHKHTTYIDITSKEKLEDVTKALNASGIYKQVEIGDLMIITEFEAKNAFNAIIKSTAIGIARYSSNTIELVAID